MTDNKPRSILDGLHAIGYARVSTDDKGQDTGTQIASMQAWANQYGVILDDVISEEVSGAKWPRTGLSEALVTVATSDAAFLLCYDSSRLTRDSEHQMPKINQMLGNKVVRFVVDADADPKSFGMQMMNAVKSVYNTEERRLIGERTGRSLRYKRDVLNQHVGRPAGVVITDDAESLRNGLIVNNDPNKKTDTIVLSTAEVLNYAKLGWTPSYVATHVLKVPACSFLRVLKKSNLKETYYQILNKEVNA